MTARPVPVIGYLRLGAGRPGDGDLPTEQARARRELHDHAHRHGLTVTTVHQDLPGTGHHRPGLAALIRHLATEHLDSGHPVNVLLPDTGHLSYHPDVRVSLGALLTDLGAQIITVHNTSTERTS